MGVLGRNASLCRYVHALLALVIRSTSKKACPFVLGGGYLVGPLSKDLAFLNVMFCTHYCFYFSRKFDVESYSP